MLMTAADYRESLRHISESVCERRCCFSVDDPRLAPGINAIGVTDLPMCPNIRRSRPPDRHVGQDRQPHGAHRRTSTDLLYKQAVRLVCKVSGCAQRYRRMTPNGSSRQPGAPTTPWHRLFPTLSQLHAPCQDEDLTLGVDRRQGRPLQAAGLQANPDTYVHIAEPTGRHCHSRHQGDRHGAPYMHELVMPCRTHVRKTPTLQSAARCRSMHRA